MPGPFDNNMYNHNKIDKQFRWLVEKLRCLEKDLGNFDFNPIGFKEISLPVVTQEPTDVLNVCVSLINALPKFELDGQLIPFFKTKLKDTHYTLCFTELVAKGSFGLSSGTVIKRENLFVVSKEKDFGIEDVIQGLKYINTDIVPETQGGFFQGEPATSSQGLTISQFNDKLLFPAIRPTISFNANNLTLERGTDYTQQITINFTQGGAGNLISYSLEKDGAEISTTQVTQFEQNNVRANFTLQGKVSHEAGVTISAGTISTQSATITQRLRIWFAPLSSVPNTSTDVRGMSSNAFDNANSLNLNTGTTNKTFVVAVPTEVTNAASLSAQDVTNNVPYTYNFIRTVDVVLPDNITEEYRVYALVVDNAYSLAANHIIQI